MAINLFRAFLVVLAVTVMLLRDGYAADLDKGLNAYQQGDYATALKELKPFAIEGEVNSLLALGLIYMNGLGVPQDYKESFNWFRLVADMGNEFGQYFVGVYYAQGLGVPQDNKEAVKWLKLAANQGDAGAQVLLGSMYLGGRGVSYNLIEAVKWFQLSAEQGNKDAQQALAKLDAKLIDQNPQPASPLSFIPNPKPDHMKGLYAYKRGDYTNALKEFMPLAKQGDANAQWVLGVMYSKGEGVSQNYNEAVRWARLAAEQRHPTARYNLGMIYENGLGVQKSLIEAEKWYRLAAELGNQPGIEALARLTRESKKTTSAYPSVPPAIPDEIPAIFPASPANIQFRPSSIRPDDIAVIIGNADYKQGNDIPNVIPAYADAASIKNYVTQALGIREENIIFLKDASQSELTATFGSKDNPKGQLFNYVKAGKSRVFIYYSGHGAPGGEEGSSYIVPTDAQASLIELNGYPLSTLYKNLGKLPAKSVTVVLEACFSGASQSGSVITQASPIYLKAKETMIPPNITVIAAGAANQIASWEQDSSSGLFTKYFLKGMSGEADARPYGNGNGKVDYDELKAYFKDTLTYYARRYYGRDQAVQIVNAR